MFCLLFKKEVCQLGIELVLVGYFSIKCLQIVIIIYCVDGPKEYSFYIRFIVFFFWFFGFFFQNLCVCLLSTSLDLNRIGKSQTVHQQLVGNNLYCSYEIFFSVLCGLICNCFCSIMLDVR